MKRNLSARELILVLLLLIVLIAIAYRAAFYLPLQEELADISARTQVLDEEIVEAAAQALRMEAMQQELDTHFRRPEQAQTEIAPFDNKSQVLAEMDRILNVSEEYSLQFSEPVVDENGTVRRRVQMRFRCIDFATAKDILQEFTLCPWRCLINNLAISGSGDILRGSIEVSATVTFLESTKLIP